mmetsp:Transcript_55005/g.170795  ORF Transcript_55005/g.170795 Transcript_55005/m.170795 type:complete len:425 (+) Transcript_55005:111-1385(+)
MQRKRKLTASCDIPQEQDSLRRSWRTGEHSDWMLELGPQHFSIHKVIVATGDRASGFLTASFRKHCGQSERTDLTDLLPRSCWPHFEALLDYVYNGDVSITIENWAAFVKMADCLLISSLYTKCIEVGSNLITADSAPRIVADAVELELGGELQSEVMQIAVEEIAMHFSTYNPKDLCALPVQVFELLLRRDDLEVLNEDQVFNFLLNISAEVGQAEMKRLWKCCRLHHLSQERIMEMASVNEIPKEAVIVAMAQRGPGPRLSAPLPAWAQGWGEATVPRGREITFLVPNPSAYAHKRHLRSVAHRLCERFWWRLLIFPLGTESTGTPRQTAAFVELVPDAGVEPTWSLRRVKYSITLVNWTSERKSVTKEHTFDFSAAELDNGWHRGWVTPDQLTAASGWVNENGEMCFRARCCVKSAAMEEP